MRTALVFATILIGVAPAAAQTAHSGAAAVESTVRVRDHGSADGRQDYWLSRDLNAMVGKFRTIRVR